MRSAVNCSKVDKPPDLPGSSFTEAMAAFLLEVGTEELPADFVESAIEQWQVRIPQSLEERLLSPEAVEVYGTPRRLAVLIKGLLAQQPDRDEEIKGPPAQVAFKNGQPTKAAAGFARKQEVDLADLAGAGHAKRRICIYSEKNSRTCRYRDFERAVFRVDYRVRRQTIYALG